MLKDELINVINCRKCAHVMSSHGLGITTLLKSLPGIYAESRPLKPLVCALAGSNKGTIAELKILINPKCLTLLIDDVELITKQIKFFVNKLINQGLNVISAGQKNVFNFSKVLKLMPLSFNESFNLVNKHLRNAELSKVIINEVGGNPALLMRAVYSAKARNDLLTSEGFSDFKLVINSFIKRKELIPVWFLAVAYPIIQSFRFSLYASRNYEQGYYLAVIAYAVMALKNFSKARS